jgi:hypothetical protein
MRTTGFMSMPEEAVPPPTAMARRRELLLAYSALIGILVIGLGTWAATPKELGGAAAASDALLPILDSIQWAFRAK